MPLAWNANLTMKCRDCKKLRLPTLIDQTPLWKGCCKFCIIKVSNQQYARYLYDRICAQELKEFPETSHDPLNKTFGKYQ